MPQFVSKNHKELIQRLRSIFIYADVIGWPDAEINLGRMIGICDADLRADVFIRISTRQAVVVEWQSEIHTPEGCKSDWFDYDDISGRDNLKRQMCAKAGIALLELWTLDMSDAILEKMVWEAAEKGCLTNTAMDYLDSTKDIPKFGSETSFVSSDKSFKTDGGWKSPGTFGKSGGFVSQKFGKGSSKW